MSQGSNTSEKGSCNILTTTSHIQLKLKECVRLGGGGGEGSNVQ
jgi:hypothetical protein